MNSEAPMKQLDLLPRDPVLDFIAKAYGKADSEKVAIIEKKLKWMVEGFAACQGQYFLFVRRYSDSCARYAGSPAGLMPPHDFSIVMTEIYLGIISGEFRFGEDFTPFRFPIRSPHAFGDLFQSPKLWAGTFFTPSECYGFEILLWLKEPKQVSDIERPGLDMAVGDEEVKALIRQYQNPVQKHYGEFPLLLPVYKMCILLGKYLHDFPEQEALLNSNRELFAKAHREMEM